MSRPSSTIFGFALGVTVAVFPAAAKAQTPPPAQAPLVRMKWQDFVAGPDGATRLQSLTRAFAKMRSLDDSPQTSADFRRSWRYWANIHGFVGNGPRSKTLSQAIDRVIKDAGPQYVVYLTGIADRPGIKDQTPPDALANLVWATCEHTGQGGPQANFFGWHRMYLYYFERVLRWAAQDPKLTLPYWDYTDPNQTALPVEFREDDSGKPVSPPLYDWRRTTALNQGSVALDPTQTNIDAPLTRSRSFLEFEGKIERGIHGTVHCAVGQTCPVALMGYVPVAGNDPIFYEHHANIDRMWSCWSRLHPDEKPGKWQEQSFNFVDENGAKVTRKVKDFLDTRALGYVYDNESDCTRAAPTRPVVAQAVSGGPRAMMSTVASKAVPLNPTSTSVDVSIAGPSGPARLKATAPRPPASTGTTLVLRDVTSSSAPGALLAVYVARKDVPADRRYVATINWFAMQDDMPGMKGMGNRPQSFEYDIAPQLAELRLTDASQVTVTFEASSGLVPAAQPPGSANLKATAVPPTASFRPEAKLSIGAVEIR